ncbi:CLUMA_CG009418, isoform A [Clunio marinus]|uniref:CLUMA_CG009418, isoform A n=1 Tax=Clunio marinus TaxID=568069 RepID=A0A1J1IC16_9DIPT|nr:CLUMA_CG009418, isoform A [Clunio marinus]
MPLLRSLDQEKKLDYLGTDHWIMNGSQTTYMDLQLHRTTFDYVTKRQRTEDFILTTRNNEP